MLGLASALLGAPVLAADPASTVDADGVVTLHVGDALEIAFPDRGDLGHPRFSRVLDHIDESGIKGYGKPDPNAPPPTGPALMSFEFKKSGGMLMLFIRNDAGVPIKYDATMVVQTPSGERSAHTSICPVFPNMMGTEQWMDPIVMLKLSGFRKAQDGSFTCD
jgi:hypothetical protein